MTIPRMALAVMLIVANAVEAQPSTGPVHVTPDSDRYQLIGVLLTALLIGLVGIWRLASKR